MRLGLVSAPYIQPKLLFNPQIWLNIKYHIQPELTFLQYIWLNIKYHIQPKLSF